MADLNLEQRIAFAAIQYDRARCEAQRLEKIRAAILCDRTEGETSHWTEPTQPAACWKNYHDGPEDRYLDEESTWCDACQQRQEVHRAYQQATRKRGARQRELHRLCELAGGWQIAPTIKLLSLDAPPRSTQEVSTDG